MNIVVVTRYTSDKGKFIHDATEWVLKNPVDRTLFFIIGGIALVLIVIIVIP